MRQMFGLLIAEDELIERQVLKKTLQKKFEGQCVIWEAENGNEAVEVFLKEDIQIVILDIGMPGLNGIQAAEAIRKESPECCIIFLTAYDRFDYAKKAISVGAMEYLLKPYSRMEIINVAGEALRLAEQYRKWRSGAAVDEEIIKRNFRFFLEEEKVWQEEVLEEREEDGTNTRLSVMTSMVEEYVRSHYMQEISMHDAARAVGYSEPYFCKMFKLQFGQSFTSYLAEYRINEAKKLLCQPNVNVKDVGTRVGYPDSNYFTKVFRRLTGMNPSEYRMDVLNKIT